MTAVAPGSGKDRVAVAKDVELTSLLSTMDPYQELTLYQRSAVLMAAAKLGLFAALRGWRRNTAGSGGTESRLRPTPCPGLLAALARSEYISRDGERFALNDFSKTFIRDGAGGMVRLAWKEHLFYTAWSRLADAISSGNALFPSFADRLANDFESVEKFLLALNDLARNGRARGDWNGRLHGRRNHSGPGRRRRRLRRRVGARAARARG